MFIDYFYKELENKTKIRKSILIFIDSLIFLIIPTLSLLLIGNFGESNISINIVFLFCGLFVFIISGHYRSILRYTSSGYFYRLILRIFIINLFSLFILNFLLQVINDFRFWILSFILNVMLMVLYRIALRDLITEISRNNKNIFLKRIAIYGAGEAGRQLASTLKYSNKYKIIFFLDDSSSKINRYLDGIPIKSKTELKNEYKKIDQILIAIPSLNQKQFRYIFDQIKHYKLPIFKVPSVEDLASGKYKIDTLNN